MSVVVSDTSPIRAFAFLHRLDVLATLFGHVLVPPAVATELAFPRFGLPPIALSTMPFLEIRAPENRELVRELAAALDPGESEALALAREIGADLVLMDESDGRGVAMKMGLKVTGTLGVLVRAKQRSLIDFVEPHMHRLQTELNFFVSPSVRDDVLRAAGEA